MQVLNGNGTCPVYTAAVPFCSPHCVRFTQTIAKGSRDFVGFDLWEETYALELLLPSH